MPVQLLPASAQAFATRSAPRIVLNTKAEPWLTQTLKRINRVKRPLNNVKQHFDCLEKTLADAAALWSLASIMLPKRTNADLYVDSNPLAEAFHNFQMIHIEAYVVHVDMVLQHEVAFKLTPETIETLIDYHKEIYIVNTSMDIYDWPEKDAQVKKLHDDYVQAINKFVFRTGVRALEGMEEDGAGELLDGRSKDVKLAIMGMFHQLLPPPPRVVDLCYPSQSHAHIAPNTMAGWYAPVQSLAPRHPAVVDPWRVLPSTPSPTNTSCSDSHSASYWQDLNLGPVQLPSPTPSFSQPMFTSAPAQFYSSPQCLPTAPAMQWPSSLNCGTDFGLGAFNDFGWSQPTFTPQYATTV